MTDTVKKTKNKKRPTLALRLFTCFAGFTAFIILILWLFQAVFLNAIYQRVKLSDMKKCADSLAVSVESGKISDDIVPFSERYNACITVFRITDGVGETVAKSHIQTACIIHNVSGGELFGKMYGLAKEEGYAVERIDIPLSKNDKVMTGGTRADHPTAVVAARTTAAGGCEYLILIDSETLPLVATTRTLKYQLIVISAFLLVASVILSLVLSDRIARPLRKMTEEASLLARGRYDVNFDCDSFSEGKELGDALNYAASELSKLDSMQKELIANISHDLRTPLTMISGYSEVMRDIPGEMTAENMQVIIDETARLSSLVSDLLELSKLQNASQTPNLSDFSLTDTVLETQNRYEHLVKKDGYRISFEADCNATVRADKTRILQVIYNLVNNAISYTGSDKRVIIAQTVSNGKVTLSVTDTGDGIPKEQLPMIWERYYKVNDFHKRAKVGTGLGLSIVKNILVMHGADFGVTSEVGSGSTFWFSLPLVRADAPSREREVAPKEPE